MRAVKLFVLIVVAVGLMCCEPAGKCSYGEKRCDGTQVQLCTIKWEWETLYDCAKYDLTCDQGRCADDGTGP